MEYCSLLWTGAPAPHLCQLHAVETKAFRIIGISRDEAAFGSLTLSLQAGHWSFLLLAPPLQSRPPALSAICPHHISAGRSKSANNPLLVKLPKSRITAHLHSFIPLFPHLWYKLPHSIQSHSSLQTFKTVVHHHLLQSPIQILDLYYPR